MPYELATCFKTGCKGTEFFEINKREENIFLIGRHFDGTIQKMALVPTASPLV